MKNKHFCPASVHRFSNLRLIQEICMLTLKLDPQPCLSESKTKFDRVWSWFLSSISPLPLYDLALEEEGLKIIYYTWYLLFLCPKLSSYARVGETLLSQQRENHPSIIRRLQFEKDSRESFTLTFADQSCTSWCPVWSIWSEVES